MKTSSTDGIVADGADRLRKALESRSTGASGENIGRRIARVIRRILCLPSIQKRRTGDEGPSPYSLFGSEPKKRRGQNSSVQSGAICFDGSLITYSSQHYGSFSVHLSEVAIIGEFTTDNGPVIDDWFMVFVRRDGGEWFEASMYADGMRSFQESLSTALGSSIICGLASSADFASRIIWPVMLADRPLFNFSPISATGCLRRIKLSILPEVYHNLSPVALSAIEPSAHPMEQIKTVGD
jgi:hypothetical protein